MSMTEAEAVDLFRHLWEAGIRYQPVQKGAAIVGYNILNEGVAVAAAGAALADPQFVALIGNPPSLPTPPSQYRAAWMKGDAQ